VLERLAHENQLEAAKTQQSYHDKYTKSHTFKVNDIVWLYKQTSILGGKTSKLKHHWKGPNTIESVVGPVTYTLKDANGKAIPETHHARHLYKIERLIL